MSKVKNLDVRIAMSEAGLYGYQVAGLLGISETSFSRALARAELSDERKQKIMEVCNNAEKSE